MSFWFHVILGFKFVIRCLLLKGYERKDIYCLTAKLCNLDKKVLQVVQINHSGGVSLKGRIRLNINEIIMFRDCKISTFEI